MVGFSGSCISECFVDSVGICITECLCDTVRFNKDEEIWVLFNGVREAEYLIDSIGFSEELVGILEIMGIVVLLDCAEISSAFDFVAVRELLWNTELECITDSVRVGVLFIGADLCTTAEGFMDSTGIALLLSSE